MKTDNGGYVTRAEIKVSFGKGSTWATKLSQIAKSKGDVLICTYSLPNIEYMSKILDKKSNVTIICHEKFQDRANAIKSRYPTVNIIFKPDIHAKIVLVEPETTILSSANFGSSGWYEHSTIIKNRDIYLYYEGVLKWRILNQQ
jgi:phosphatidylserine/phosphatidylglycerophosphate/cardiolipin synthase-like enzyme